MLQSTESSVIQYRNTYNVFSDSFRMKKQLGIEHALPQKIKEFYASKKLLFATWDCESPDGHTYQNLYSAFKNVIPRVLLFGIQKNLHIYGKNGMNEQFIELVKSEKPDYILINVLGDEIPISTLVKIKHIAPRAIVMNLFGDDDTQFEAFSRYLALFVDYCCTTQSHCVSAYLREKIQSVFPFIGVNTEVYKPLQLEKKYDLTFVGIPRNDRVSIIEFLIKKGIQVTIFGSGWDKYPHLKKYWKGFVTTDELIRIINQSKINLNFLQGGFAKGHLHMKGRIVEVAACKSFQLFEHYPQYFKLFKKNEIVMFKDRDDLVKKIKYYLTHESEREEFAARMYRTTVRKYSRQKEVNSFFTRLYRERRKFSHRPLPVLTTKTFVFQEQDAALDSKTLEKKTNGFDYIIFKKRYCKDLPYRIYIQMYSLIQSGKDISCCEYYVNHPILGDYLLSKPYKASYYLPKEELHNLISVNQLMVTREYFLNNLEKLKSAFGGEPCSFISNSNMVFVSFPLVQVRQFKEISYKSMGQSFEMKYLHELAGLSRKKKSAFLIYFVRLVLTSYAGKKNVLKNIIHLINKENILKALV